MVFRLFGIRQSQGRTKQPRIIFQVGQVVSKSNLFEYILNVSLKEVDYIIRNFKDSRSERNQLKNLGAWLGRITLANDKPLRRDYIALKFLLVEAYDFNSLPLILPFVCKILDQAQYSKCSNHQTLGLLGL